MLNNVVWFVRKKYPYFLGFCLVEGGIYYFDGPTGNFTTGFLGLFTIWIYYSWISKERPSGNAPGAAGEQQRNIT